MRKGLLIAAVLMLCMLPLVAGCGENDPNANGGDMEQTANQMNKSAKRTARHVADFAAATRDEFMQKADKALDDMDQKTEDVKKRFWRAEERTKDETRDLVGEMAKARVEAKQALKNARGSGEDAWKDARKSFSKAYADLKDAYQAAEAELKEKNGK